MTLKQYQKKIDGMTPDELEEFIKTMSYDDIYQLWKEMSGGNIDIYDEPQDRVDKIEQALLSLLQLEIFANTLSNVKVVPKNSTDNGSKGGDA